MERKVQLFNEAEEVVQLNYGSGLVLLDADKNKGHVLGNFATTDHTGIPVPLMSYGPGAELFQGFLDNTEIAKRIYQLLNFHTK